MGISLMAYYSSIGHKVIGVDINKKIVGKINKGNFKAHSNLELYLRLQKSYKLGLIEATTNLGYAIKKCKVIIVIVPLVVNKKNKVDYSSIISVSEKISDSLRRERLVIYETTLPIGDTKKIILPILEKNGLKCGKDFWLVYSPERASPQNIFFSLNNYPKIVGGVNKESTKKGAKFYKKVLKAEVIVIEDSETAEAVKLFGMVYRDVNIALANEFAKFCQKKNLNVSKIIRLTNTNPYSHILSPGIGVGGHCTPIYPYFLINGAEKLKIKLKLVKTARRINENMPLYVINLLKKTLKKIKGKKILILGLGYKEKSRQYFLSPSLRLIKKLKSKGAIVYLNDSCFVKKEIRKIGAIPVNMNSIKRLDIVILVTYNKKYEKIDWENLKKKGLKLVIDGRNILKREKIIKYGINYKGIGIN